MNELIFPHTYRPGMEQYGDREAIVDGAYRSTWSQHDDRLGTVVKAYIDSDANRVQRRVVGKRQVELEHRLERAQALWVHRIDGKRAAPRRSQGPRRELVRRRWHLARDGGGKYRRR